MQGGYFVNTELWFSPGQLLFSSPTDFMSYSMFQLLTKYLAGAILPIYCQEHLRKHNKNSSYNIPQLKKKKKKLAIM